MSKKRRTRKEIGGLFTHLDRRSRSAETVTPTDKLAARIDFEVFRPLLAELVPSRVSDKGGRPPHDSVLMFKVLVLQYYYGLSDERVEFEILDRTSFQRFLGIEAEGAVPDRTSV
jgi:IS5 family transposase